MTSHSDAALNKTTLLLCRHGQSEWNALRRVQGQSPLAGGLTELGRWEAQQLGVRLQTAGVSTLYTSDLRRACETAEIVGAHLNMQPQTDVRWREIDLGIWQGLTREEIDRGWPSDEIYTLDLPRGEIGETFAALIRRTVAAIHDLHARHPGQTVAVICHGGNVRAALLAAEVSATDGPDPRRLPILNTSVTLLQVDSAGLRAGLIADASHLDGKLPVALSTNEEDDQR